MTDIDAVIERLAAQDPAEKKIRNGLIERGYSIREATARAARMTSRVTRPRPAASQQAIALAVAEAVASATAARKAAKKATKRATAEAAPTRMSQERQRVAARFTETAISASLLEAGNSDLAAIAATALSGTGQPSPADRPMAEMTIDPQKLDLGDLGLAAAIGTAGNSPFWTGQTAGDSPFWRGLQGSEARGNS